MAKHVKREVDRGSGASGPRMGRGAGKGIGLASALAALLVGAGAAVAQPTKQWQAQQWVPGVDAEDIGREMAFWTEGGNDPVNYVYVVGTLHLEHGRVKSVIAVYKYDLADDDPATAVESQFFPDPEDEDTEGLSEGMGIVIHEGHVYVVGTTTMQDDGSFDDDLNIVTIKLDTALDFDGSWAGSGARPVGVRVYDGPAGGDDRGVDIGVDIETDDVFVTGASEGDETGYDIATIRYEDTDGSYSAAWPTIQGLHPDVGRRRYNHSAADGDDTPARMGVTHIADVENPDPVVCIVGTSYGGATTLNDILTIMYNEDGDETSTNGWVHRQDEGDDDVGTGLAIWANENDAALGVFVCGYSVMPPPSLALGPGGCTLTVAEDTDYTFYRLDPVDGSYEWTSPYPNVRHWNGAGGQYGNDDYAVGIVFMSASGNPGQFATVWVTGTTRTGNHFDIGTVLSHADTGATLDDDVLDYGGSDDRAAGLVGEGGFVYVAGSGVDDDNATWDYLLLRNHIHQVEEQYFIELDWVEPWDKAQDDAGHEVAFGLGVSPATSHVLVTGYGNTVSTAGDFFTLNYLDNDP